MMHQPRKGFSALFAVTGLMVAFHGIGGEAAAQDAVKFQANTPLVIGYTAQDISNPYWQNYAAGVKAEAAKNDIKVVVADAKASQQN